MRRWLEVCFIASAASAPSFGGSRRGTIVDTTVSSRTGQCKLLLTRPRRSRVTVLHVELIGRGSAALASTSLNLLDEGICKCGNDRVVCIVQMDRSRGATVMTLPPIARFLIAHGHRMRPIFVLEAKGPALAAVRVVKRLSGLNRRVRCFSSLENFEAECASKNDDAYLEAQSVACAIRRRQEWQSWLHTPPWREHVQGASAQLRESITKLRGGALAHKLAKTSIVGAQMTTRDHRRRPRGECVVRVDGEWYDLSNFDHPGGGELLTRHAGMDITHLFYSNHFEPIRASRRLGAFRVHGATDGSGVRRYTGDTAPLVVAPKSEACSEDYLELKRRVASRLEAAGVDWRHAFSPLPYAFRAACLLTCATVRVLAPGDLEWLALVAAAAYGLATGRQTWTHAHNGVHNPHAIPPHMRSLLKYDFVGVVDVWMSEHHAHHAHTNDAHLDPDVRWWWPLYSYADVYAHGGSWKTLLLSACAYPLLVPVMLLQSLRHAIAHDPHGRRTLAFVLAVAPMRFGIDIALLGAAPFGIAIGAATAYIVGTFVATHQLADNHAFAVEAEEGDVDGGARVPECWMARQLRATNNVLAGDELWSAACGGINNHIEHHLFPQVSSAVLPHVVPVVRDFAAERGLPYRNLAPWELAREHVRFLKVAASER